MDPPTIPLRPFSFQPEESRSSPPARTIENSTTPAPRFPANHESRDLPATPNKNPRRSQTWNDTTRSWEIVNPERHSLPAQHVGLSTFQQTAAPRSPTLQQPLPSSTPPMTKSSQKILQLTGFDPRFERALPKAHQQLFTPTPTSSDPPIPHSPVRSISSNSTGSFYSQVEAGFRYELAAESSGAVAQSSNDEGERLTPSIYNISEHGSKSSNTSHDNVKTRMNISKTVSQVQSQEDIPQPPSFPTNIPSNSTEMVALPEILAEERLRNEKGVVKGKGSADKQSLPMCEPVSVGPVLEPLALPPKTGPRSKKGLKPRFITVEKEKKSLFRSARGSLEWGIYDVSNSGSPSKSKHFTTPVSPMFSMESDHLRLSPPLGSSKETKKRIFGTGRHPLKSPFPFGAHAHRKSDANGGGLPSTAEEEEEEEEKEEEDQETRDTVPSPSTARGFTRRLSHTLKHLSPTSPTHKTNRSSPPSSKKHVITNGARRADGPATPMPPKNGFMADTLHEVVGKVKKSVVGPSKDEKRRQSLKNRIVVVGITDQSPDGRVAQWL